MLPIGARFEFRGRCYTKLALSMASDDERLGNIFQDETEVTTSDDVKLVSNLREFSKPDWTKRLHTKRGRSRKRWAYPADLDSLQ